MGVKGRYFSVRIPREWIDPFPMNLFSNRTRLKSWGSGGFFLGTQSSKNRAKHGNHEIAANLLTLQGDSFRRGYDQEGIHRSEMCVLALRARLERSEVGRLFPGSTVVKNRLQTWE